MTGPARGQEAQEGKETGPIDPTAGAWITYRGERTVPGQPEPQAYSLRVSYGLPPETSQYGKLVMATETQFDASGRATGERTLILQTADRLYRNADGTEEGYWIYWLPPGLEKDDAAAVESSVKLTADEVQDFDFKGERFQVLRMRGGGIELLVERRTGLVFRIAREGGETLGIEDTNMLANHRAWDYSPDDAEVGRRLQELADEHPNLVEVSSVGRSANGRNIWLVHVTDYTSSEMKSNVILDAATEGDAPEGCAFLLDFLEEIVDRAAEDDSVASLLRGINIYALPLLNPDGVQRWLAMPDPAESLLIAGQAPRNGNLVNIDRNFDVKWEEGNRDPSAWDYAGPSPFSEPESQALRELFEDVPADMYISMHGGVDLVTAPWNWSELPASNPEKDFYEGILMDVSGYLPFPFRIGAPHTPFTGSSTDWAYEGNGSSSPICFNLYLHSPQEGEGDPLSSYSPHREAIITLMENLRSYLAVDISVPRLRVEVNVPIDAVVEITVSGKRALPNTRARLVLPEDSGLKFSSMADKEISLGDLEPGSTTRVVWNLEGRTGGSNTATVILTSSYPDYDKIPGTYSADLEVSISTQRTWLVLALLSILILIVLGIILLSMRKHRRLSGDQTQE